MVEAGGHERFQTTSAIAIVAGTGSYSLPATHYRTIGLVLEWAAGRWEEVPDFNRVLDRVPYLNVATWQEGGLKAYRNQGTSIVIVPTPTSAVTGRLYFVPVYADFTHDTTDTKDCVNGWEKLVALKVAMEMRAIEQQPNGDLERMYEREAERVTNMAGDRDDHAPRIGDVAMKRFRLPDGFYSE
jgi:hypothetical protein